MRTKRIINGDLFRDGAVADSSFVVGDGETGGAYGGAEKAHCEILVH